MRLIHLSRKFYNNGHVRMALKIQAINKYLTTVDISPMATIGEGFRLIHGNGIIIGSGVTIGDDCIVYQQVTIGEDRTNKSRKPPQSPTIGNNVTIYAGAKIVGGVTIGDNCEIGANAVVINDVPDNCTAVGIPARVIRHDKPINDFNKHKAEANS